MLRGLLQPKERLQPSHARIGVLHPENHFFPEGLNGKNPSANGPTFARDLWKLEQKANGYCAIHKKKKSPLNIACYVQKLMAAPRAGKRKVWSRRNTSKATPGKAEDLMALGG